MEKEIRNLKKDKLIEIIEQGVLNIRKADAEATSKLSNIRDAHNEILNDEVDSSIKTQLNGLLEDHSSQIKAIQEEEKRLLGYDEEENHVDGIIDDINNFHDQQVKEYEALYQKIEGLLPGSISVSLAEAFNSKATEYKEERKEWENKSYWALISLLIVSIIFTGVVIWKELDVNTLILYATPIYTFSIWLVIFIGNRRAESRKLEELYKHKDVMASSYMGYEKSIESLSSEDSKLKENLMMNLMDSINDNPSEFLSVSGEKHPVIDAIFGRKKIYLKS
ncbi:hypothetical protein BHECKSOX_424 [Bathymodiolus heckerae thiotrophic gill symbiont]|uniref:hypothetical protein n=1 Tax=Bathymodiolus heckerae thiotrophic gill symbiont TaxID=1052212 RepID=UPI0010BAAD0C|nr:hypothetical protein [Bathymodiolus heckerae thiotrophic gill symbiont]SHN90261.1 hypothetical protein BHECKSOX_424 [Bathymodiolus heckerae thiotrophic gill symbiont]